MSFERRTDRMSGHRKFSNLNHKASADQVEAARARLSEEIALHELRVAMGFTQMQLAEALEMTQPGISRLERQSDLLLSTLRSYVAALGGRLVLSVETAAGDQYVIERLGEIREREPVAETTSRS
jgi:hypothetical protein